MKKNSAFILAIVLCLFQLNINATEGLGCIGFCPGVNNNGICLISEATLNTCVEATPEQIRIGYKLGKLPCNVEASNANSCPPT